ncbi:MAG: HDIG domain-containing protein [Pirellulaceae bacterium]|nr:HDIG domain-containing protein [Pirellulaceae bacterium]
MASSNPVRTRSERVASLQLEPSALRRQLNKLLAGKSLLHLAIAVGSIGIIVFTLQGWVPPFTYREGQIPDRDIVARVAFDLVDDQQTKLLRDQRRRETLCTYENRTQAITQLRSALQNQMLSLVTAKSAAELTAEQARDLELLIKNLGSDPTPLTSEAALTHIRSLLSDSDQSTKFNQALQLILNPIAESGVIKSLSHDSDQGSQRSIIVIPIGSPTDEVFVDVSKVRYADVIATLSSRVSEVLQREFSSPDVPAVARIVSHYLVQNLPETLTYRADLSEKARISAEAAVPDAMVSYFPTVSRLAAAGQPITRQNHLPLLRAEYDAWVAQLGAGVKVTRLLCILGMILAFYTFCGAYIYYLHDAKLLTQTVPMLRLLSLVLFGCVVSKFAASDPWQAEIVPVLITAIVMTITFGRQLTILISICSALMVSLAVGLNMVQLVTMCSGSCAAAMFVGRIRTRSKLIYVGLATGAVVAITHLGADTIIGTFLPRTLDAGAEASTAAWTTLMASVVGEPLRIGALAFLAAAVVAGVLSFIEPVFGVQTDLRLLELGDASHPLLRQLAQRAPGTYNHSISVAAIAEAAADSIGAHGLLTRVGAYFHDIGKMFKPNYFVENQDASGNCHDTLQPAMSTLVIIAHVKDGSDLARQHRLPTRIVDFIEQHHGTTLVEYFYREATKRSQDDPNKEEVSETAFRYPGPKPQTLEAAVLMLADSVESASRTLVEPTVSRLQSLVDKIAMSKLLDGQFDECGLTLLQLDQVKSSLVKSLTAIYHGRVKYTGQASA